MDTQPGMSVPGDFHGLPVVSGPPWPGIQYFCTTRAGGVSAGAWATLNLGAHVGDAAHHVTANRRRLQQGLPGQPLWLQQIHGVHVHDADEGVPLPADDALLPQADAAVTAHPSRVLAILTADCLPVVIAHTDARVLGVAHAGWRGLLAGVLENTLQALHRKCHHPESAGWRAWIGPGISQKHFEVGDEVHTAFIEQDAAQSAFFLPGRSPGKWQADLAGIARRRLHRAGVAQVDASGLCTYEYANHLFSYRRDGMTGRLATLAWIAPDPSEAHATELP